MSPYDELITCFTLDKPISAPPWNHSTLSYDACKVYTHNARLPNYRKQQRRENKKPIDQWEATSKSTDRKKVWGINVESQADKLRHMLACEMIKNLCLSRCENE